MQIKIDNIIYTEVDFEYEKDFEKHIIDNNTSIFGDKGLFINTKRKMGTTGYQTIPDCLFVDLKFENSPKLYLIENELSSHSFFDHIGIQLLRFALASENDKFKIKNILLNEINTNSELLNKTNTFILKSKFNNINELIDEIIYNQQICAVVIIDKNKVELQKILSKINMRVDVLEFKTFKHNEKYLYQYDIFQEDVFNTISTNKSNPIIYENLDTIICPGETDGFKETFLDNNCWYAVRMSSVMLDKIKYIAGYQTYPICAITHIAEVSHIEKYEDTDKYIIYFKERAKEINHIKLPKNSKLAPRSPRYTNLDKLLNSKNLDELFN